MTHRTNICCAMTLVLPLFSHMMAIPPANAPARAACHLLVFFLMRVSWALALSDKRAFRLDVGMGTWRVVPGCSAVGPDSRSSSTKGEEWSSRWNGSEKGRGWIAGMRMGKALSRNLYRNVKVPVRRLVMCLCKVTGIHLFT